MNDLALVVCGFEVRDLERPHGVERPGERRVDGALVLASPQISPNLAQDAKDLCPIEPLALAMFAVAHSRICTVSRRSCHAGPHSTAAGASTGRQPCRPPGGAGANAANGAVRDVYLTNGEGYPAGVRAAEHVSVELTDREIAAKRKALAEYKSQLALTGDFMRKFAAANELFSRPRRARVTLPLRQSPCDAFEEVHPD